MVCCIVTGFRTYCFPYLMTHTRSISNMCKHARPGAYTWYVFNGQLRRVKIQNDSDAIESPLHVPVLMYLCVHTTALP